jgi:hypothetical protein
MLPVATFRRNASKLFLRLNLSLTVLKLAIIHQLLSHTLFLTNQFYGTKGSCKRAKSSVESGMMPVSSRQPMAICFKNDVVGLVAFILHTINNYMRLPLWQNFPGWYQF